MGTQWNVTSDDFSIVSDAKHRMIWILLIYTCSHLGGTLSLSLVAQALKQNPNNIILFSLLQFSVR